MHEKFKRVRTLKKDPPMTAKLGRNVFFIFTMTLFAFASLGCEAMQSVLADMDKPTARVMGVNISSFNAQSATLDFDVSVNNPYQTDIPLVNLGYALSSKGTQMLDGEAALTGVIPAGSSRRVTIPVNVPYQPVLQVLSGVKPGNVVPYEAKLSIFTDVPAAGRISLPTQTKGNLPIPIAPVVSVANVRWTQMDLTNIAGEIDLSVKNGNDFGLNLSELGYTLSLADTQVANAVVDKPVDFKAGQSQTMKIPISLSPLQLGTATFNLLKGNKGSYSIQGNIAADTPYGQLAMPYSNSGTAPFSR
jgi:LEA14-like dessication related protein